MIEDLLKAKKIPPELFKLYSLFQVNELGRECLETMMFETFMDEPSREKTEFNGVGFAFYDGRRSVWRDIRRAIIDVQNIMREFEDEQRRKQ